VVKWKRKENLKKKLKAFFLKVQTFHRLSDLAIVFDTRHISGRSSLQILEMHASSSAHCFCSVLFWYIKRVFV